MRRLFRDTDLAGTVAFARSVLAGMFLFALGAYSAAGQTVNLYPNPSIADFPRIQVPFVIEVDIQNDGSPGTVAGNVMVTNIVPAGLTVVSSWIAPYVQLWNIYDGSWNYFSVDSGSSGNTLWYNAGNIPNMFHRPIQITVVADQPGTYNDVITVTGQGTGVYPRPGPLVYPILVHTNGLFVTGGQSIVESSGSNAAFVVSLSPASSVPVTIDYRTVDGTATAGQDYQPVSGTLTFLPGITNLTVLVPVLDDNLAEAPSQSFFLQLTNAVNAELSGVSTPNYVLDDEPPLQVAIADAPPVLEGDGTTNLDFPVQLSEPADVPIQLSYSTTGAVVTSGTVTVPAGATNTDLLIQVVGDVSVQSNRTVEVTLSAPTPLGTLSRSVADGLIVEDDGLPGKLTHMQLTVVPSPQLVGRPFPAALTLLDSYNNPATNFAGQIELDSYTQVGWQMQFVQTFFVTNFVQGIATNLFTYPAAASNALLVAWYITGSGPVTAITPSFRVIPSPALFLSLPASASEGDGVLPGAGRVSITNVDVQDVLVSLVSSDLLEIQVPPSVLIPAGQTSAVFDVTIVDDTRLDGTHSTSVSASAPYYMGTSQSISVADNESATLTLNLPSSISEAKGSNSASATVSASSAPALPILVALTASPPGQLFVPAGIYIQAGQTSATFTVSAIQDNVVDGDRSVTVTAHVPNWVDAVATTLVQDANNTLRVSLTEANTPPIEGLGTLTNWLHIFAGGYVSNAVTVQLISSNPAKALVPPAVVIPAGQQGVSTNITFPDDALFDGTQTVTITASSAGFTPGALTISIADNDVYRLSFSAINASQTNGVPFRVTLTAQDVNNTPMTVVEGSISLSAMCAGKVLPVTPASVSSVLRGLWSGNVTVTGWGTNIQLVATATNGVSGLSNPFTIPTPPWVQDLRFSRLQLDVTGLRLFFNSYTGHLYEVEMSTNLPPVWWPLGSAQSGTGAEISLLDPAAPAPPARFYRLSASP